MRGARWNYVIADSTMRAVLSTLLPLTAAGSRARRCDDLLIERWVKAGASKRLLAVGAELRGKRFTTLDGTRAALRAAVAKVNATNCDGADGFADFAQLVQSLQAMMPR